MLKKLWQACGRVAFWLAYPVLFIYLRIGSRTRVLVIVDDSVLLVKGWLSSGQWQLPGGGVHKKEVPVDAVKRELREETGVVLPAKKLQFFYQAQTGKGLRFRYSCYYAQLTTRPVLRKQLLEITHLEWVPLKAVTSQNATDDTYQAIQDWLKR